MSYYESNYYQNPGPVYVTTDIGEPVPGWGVMPNMAGPKRVGVGQAPVAEHQLPGSATSSDVAKVGPLPVGPVADSQQASSALPWWGWVLGAAAIGVGVGVARNRGWL